MLIAISESRRPRRNSVRYPVNAGLNALLDAEADQLCNAQAFSREERFVGANDVLLKMHPVSEACYAR
jgi:hypothetical protein